MAGRVSTAAQAQQVREEVSRQLAPMFEKARREGLYFLCRYQGMEFSPDELQAEQAQGRLNWGAVNWELRPVAERVKHAEESVAKAQLNLVKIREWAAKQ